MSSPVTVEPQSAGQQVPEPLVRGLFALAPTAPVVVKIPPHDAAPAATRTIRVAAVTPCFNRRADAAALLGDLCRLATRVGGCEIDLRVLVVDNASDEPLSTLPTPEIANGRPLRVEHLRLERNTGGAGGYNAGMQRVLGWHGLKGNDGWDPEYVWLVDSDARVAPETLARLAEALERHDDVIAAGSAIVDPQTGQVFEIGGHQNRKSAHFEPMTVGGVGVTGDQDGLVECDYVAACSALVRSSAIRSTGVFPDRFLNGDDVEWFLRMKEVTGGRVVGVPGSLAMHPRFDRFPTWTRYYMCRNAFGPIDASRTGMKGRWRRALRETLRAVQQEMMGRSDLARLHIAGLRDAAAGRMTGQAARGVIDVLPAIPMAKLSEIVPKALAAAGATTPPARMRVQAELGLTPAAAAELDRQVANLVERGTVRVPGSADRAEGVLVGRVIGSLMGAARRWLLGPGAEVAIVPSRGRPSAWFSGRTMIECAGAGFVVRTPTRLGTPLSAAGTLAAGMWHGARLAIKGTPRAVLTQAPGAPKAAARPSAPAGVCVAAVVLSYNRWDDLRDTVRRLVECPVFDAGSGGRIIVADNASTDGTPSRLAREFPPTPAGAGGAVQVMRMASNIGVEAFNRAAATLDGHKGAPRPDLLLILDDDAWVDDDALIAAISLMAKRKELGAVTFLPRHPESGLSEWSFAAGSRGADEAWPVMGCANLIRREAWAAAGGYDKSFFLYRNDTDLALRLLAAGWGVHMNPAWPAWHNTAAGAGGRKSLRWHRLATRNWLWTARRHGRGLARIGGGLLGWAWAHALAGLSPARQWQTLLGGLEGLARRPAKFSGFATDGSHFRRLVGMQLSRFAGAGGRGGR